ncbi:TetR/AcrR family transcriptional regulator [Rhizorhabdus argentea]|uniref:TetR/AcrR family transcriptional regulator n=1 Tax=Rhizorhabdus argentea TaxID=1387174 RepID=UPI0030EECBCA
MIDIEVPASIKRRRGNAQPPSKRAEEIAEQAICLFNIFGASRFSVNRVAEELGISPGNLHYHFRTNSDLFLTLFGRLETEIRVVLTRPKMPMTFQDLVVHQIDVQRCLWRHRYFFRDLDFLIHIDEQIFLRFLDLQDWSIQQIVDHQELYRNNFNMLPLKPPNNELEIARNCWMMWTSWVRWEAIAGGEKEPSGEALNQIIHRLTWYHFSHHLPYIDPLTGVAIQRKLIEILGPK